MAGNHPQSFGNEKQSNTPFPSSPGEVDLDGNVCSLESFDYYPDEQEYRAIFDSETVSPSTAVACSVSEITEQAPIDREPLYSVIDPDALDAIVTRRPSASGDAHVTFELTGYAITVSSYGGLVISPTRSNETPAGR